MESWSSFLCIFNTLASSALHGVIHSILSSHHSLSLRIYLRLAMSMQQNDRVADYLNWPSQLLVESTLWSRSCPLGPADAVDLTRSARKLQRGELFICSCSCLRAPSVRSSSSEVSSAPPKQKYLGLKISNMAANSAAYRCHRPIVKSLGLHNFGSSSPEHSR